MLGDSKYRNDVDKRQDNSSENDDNNEEDVEIEDINFYFDHVYSVVEHVLNAEFFEFYK